MSERITGVSLSFTRSHFAHPLRFHVLAWVAQDATRCEPSTDLGDSVGKSCLCCHWRPSFACVSHGLSRSAAISACEGCIRQQALGLLTVMQKVFRCLVSSSIRLPSVLVSGASSDGISCCVASCCSVQRSYKGWIVSYYRHQC